MKKHHYGGQNCVMAHWHGDELPLVAYFAYRNAAVLSSFSKDGTLMAKVLRLLGYQVFRGSSSRGGARGLLNLVKVVKSGSQGALAVDGPRGPIYEVKPGIADLAIRTGVPLICVRARAFSSWTFDSTWNKCYLPKPFSRIQVVFSEAIDTSVQDRDLSKKEQNEHVCEQVKAMLDTVMEKYPV